MAFLSLFKRSASEFRSVRCLTVTSVLIAVYVIIEFFSIDVAGLFKINFAFLALAAIGMLFGPAVSAVAAIACDIVGAMSRGDALNFVYTLIAIVEGLIYGYILYGFRMEKKASQWFRIALSRTIVVLIINIVMNTTANYLFGYIDTSVPLYYAIGTRVIKNLLELPVDLALMYALLVPIKASYERVFPRVAAGRQRKD